MQPYFGYSGRARATDYPIGVNISTSARAAWRRPSYGTLKAIIAAYDVARMCVNHKIDELRSMEPMFLPAEGINDDVDDEIAGARLILAKPDRQLPFDSWLSKWLENAFKYDSAPLHRLRNYNGDVCGLEVIDGTTINPYIDEDGRQPEPPAPAYYQAVHGMVAQWFTTDDIEFVPFRPQEDSPFGLAPIESILLTANTDIRFQWHFLQMFTDGSVPAGFMELPPDISSPEQVAEWQDYWDAVILGDQAKLAQLIAVPNGTKFTGTKPATFDKTFPQYLMARTCAAHGVLPQELGLIEDVNRSNGDNQADIQFRVHTLPWVRWVEGHLTRYLQNDWGLRVQVKLNTGRDKEDLLAEAQAHQIYWEIGAESSDEIRTDILGKAIDKERPIQRTVMVERVGPIPLLSIEGISGKTDADTYGPAKDQPALDQPYVPPTGVIATPGTTDDQASLTATDQYQVYHRRELEQQQGGTPARESREAKRERGAKAGEHQAAAHTEATEDTPEAPDVQDGEQQQPGPGAKAPGKQQVAKQLDGREAAELAAFREFVRVRVRKGEWERDFGFFTVAPHLAVELNRGGRAEVAAGRVEKAKASPGKQPSSTPAAAGIAVRARDTGRVLMLQRGLDPGDPASGAWEFPGGCIEDGEAPTLAARREWEEEVGCRLPDGEQSGAWTSSNGVYAGFVWTVPSEHAIRIDDPRDRTLNPDDPGRDHVEAIAWWDPAQLPGNPAVRRELAADIGRVTPHLRGTEVAKARLDPKVSAGQSTDWPGWAFDQEAAAYWAPRIAAALAGALNVQLLVDQFEASRNRADRKQHETAAIMQAIARAWLASYLAALIRALRPVLERVWIDGYVIGAASAQAYLAGQASDTVLAADLAHWSPGDTDAAQLLLGQSGDGSGLRALLKESDVMIKSIAETRLDELGQILGDSVAAGLDPAVIAEKIRDLLTNTSRALMIAVTELSRAVSKAAEERYRKAGYFATEWLTEPGACPICIANRDRGPVPIGQRYPSGDLRPPAHPHCRCVPIPARVEM